MITPAEFAPTGLAGLVARAQTGDTTAFDALHAQYEAPIHNHVSRLMGHGEDARELTQDVFLKAWLALTTGKYQAEERFQAWLYRVATNVCLDELRHRKLVRWERLENVLAQTPHRVGLFVSLDPQDYPHRVVELDETAAEIDEVLRLLPLHYRLVLSLRHYADLSYNDIAAQLGATRPAIKSLLFRARQEFAAHCRRDERYAHLMAVGA